MRQDVQRVIEERYDSARRNHTRNGVQFQLTLDEFTKLWSAYRVSKIQRFLDSNQHGKLRKWFRHPDHGPVCTWVSKQARADNILSAATAQVTTRKKSLWLFRIQAGDTHKPETIAKMRKPKAARHRANMRKPKSPAAIENMRQAACERWARVRAEKESQR